MRGPAMVDASTGAQRGVREAKYIVRRRRMVVEYRCAGNDIACASSVGAAGEFRAIAWTLTVSLCGTSLNFWFVPHAFSAAYPRPRTWNRLSCCGMHARTGLVGFVTDQGLSPLSASPEGAIRMSNDNQTKAKTNPGSIQAGLMVSETQWMRREYGVRCNQSLEPFGLSLLAPTDVEAEPSTR